MMAISGGATYLVRESAHGVARVEAGGKGARLAIQGNRVDEIRFGGTTQPGIALLFRTCSIFAMYKYDESHKSHTPYSFKQKQRLFTPPAFALHRSIRACRTAIFERGGAGYLGGSLLAIPRRVIG